MSSIKVALLGDIAPFGKYCFEKNGDEVKGQLSAVSEFLKDYDIVIGNLEAPFVNEGKTKGFKSAHVSLRETNVDILNYLGVTHVTLANNHICDFGDEAVLKTIKLLDENGIGWFGVNGKAEEIEVKGQKLAMLGYCSFNTNPSLGKKYSINELDVDDVEGQLSDVVTRGFFPILSVHSGQEHIHLPSSDDVNFARKIAKRFDYCYHGHHPHVVQGCEDHLNSVIYYSLGNFIFDDVYTPRDKNKPLVSLSQENKTGIIVSLNFCGGVISHHEATPIYLSHDKVFVGDDVKDFSMDQYNQSLLAAGSEEYDAERKAQISKFIDGRKKLRNFSWYLKRLNINSIGIIVGAKINASKYRRHFLNKVNSL